ncbi:MRN complex-interacting protein [Stegostoma tigrinum]|uniref:MRN complex-interacting protein n=1 Tax=Stegostoma tigrinum TaxID=3053191 RepID=UPI00202B1F96|nr:MRN complex-interacting protein [Stegostoma tigrinum]
MAQRFQVLRCCLCKIYQVQQVKKSKKWNCKLCEAKQSVLKIYGQGSGADCRRHVQKLNMLQGERMQAMEAAACFGGRSIKEPKCANTDCNSERLCTVNEQLENSASSRWSVYLDQNPIIETSDEEGKEKDIVYTDRQRFQESMRNANRNRSKHKRGLCTSKQLELCGNGTDNQETESSQTAMGRYLKCMNSTLTERRNGHQVTRHTERNNISNSIHLESNLVTSLNDESWYGTIKQQGAHASRWDRFLPRSMTEDDEFFSQGTGKAEGYLTWKGAQPSADSAIVNYRKDVDGFAGLRVACNGHPSSLQITERITEETMTCSLTSLEQVEEDRTMLSLPEPTTDVHTLSSIACGAVTEEHDPFSVSMDGASGASCVPKSGSPLAPQSLSFCQLSVREKPRTDFGFQAKQGSCFLSLFQTDEDFDDA